MRPEETVSTLNCKNTEDLEKIYTLSIRQPQTRQIRLHRSLMRSGKESRSESQPPCISEAGTLENPLPSASRAQCHVMQKKLDTLGKQQINSVPSPSSNDLSYYSQDVLGDWFAATQNPLRVNRRVLIRSRLDAVQGRSFASDVRELLCPKGCPLP